MKCPKCGKSVDTAAGMKFCPFCGAPAAEEKHPDDLTTMPEVFGYLLTKYGKEVFAGQRLAALAGDLCSGLDRELRLVRMAIQSGAYAEMVKADGLDGAGKAQCFARQKLILEENYFVNPQWADSVLMWLADCLGWALPGPEEKQAPEPAPQPRKKTAPDQSGAGSDPREKPPLFSAVDEILASRMRAVPSSMEHPGSMAVGDHVIFGSYPQDDTGGTGIFKPDPIMWRVLDIKDGGALLISEYGLDTRPFNAVKKAVSWKDCSLRAWLNDAFLKNAFSEVERKSMITVTGEDPDGPTKDTVFCLSARQADRYFKDDKDRRAAPTDYAIMHRALMDDEYYLHKIVNPVSWWLRSPGTKFFSNKTNPKSAAYVYKDGSIIGLGMDVSFGCYCVRPAMWVSL